MTRVKKVLLLLLGFILLGAIELVREEVQYRRSAAYKLENAAQQLKRRMTRNQVIQILGDTELKVSAEQFDYYFEVWTWKEERYQKRLWSWMGAKKRSYPLEITAFFTDEGLYDVIIENF